LNAKDYLKELVDELIDVATDYGRNPRPSTELALAESSEMLYNAIQTMEHVSKKMAKVSVV